MRLFDFAFVPPQLNYLDQIANLAVRENWGENYSYLRDYCDYNIEIAVAQNLIYRDPPADRFAIWRIGHLVTNDGTPLYAFFAKNSVRGKQDYVLLSIQATHNVVFYYRLSRNGPQERIPILTPPKEPRYEIPDYQPTYRIEYDWAHFLVDHRDRLEKDLPGVRGDRLLYLAIFGAVELAHRLHKLNAVPQYFRGRYQYLLPLYITHDHFNKRPDEIAALQEDRDRGVYRVETLLPPSYAYANARAIATNIAQFRSWIDEEPASSTDAGATRETSPRLKAVLVNIREEIKEQEELDTSVDAEDVDAPEQQRDSEASSDFHPPPKTKAQLFEAALANYSTGDFDKALEAMNLAIALDPEDAAAHYNRAIVLFQLAAYGDALEACKKSIDLDARSASAHFVAGAISLKLGMKEQAIQWFGKARELFRAQGNHAEAEKAYQEARKLGYSG